MFFFGPDVKTPWANLSPGWVGVQVGRVTPGPFKKKELREAIGAAAAITVVIESYEEDELISSAWAAFPEGVKTADGPFRAAVG